MYLSDQTAAKRLISSRRRVLNVRAAHQKSGLHLHKIFVRLVSPYYVLERSRIKRKKQERARNETTTERLTAVTIYLL